jgi:hypothetical protein
MNTVKVAVQLTTDEILAAIVQFDTSELEFFATQINQLIIQRKTASDLEAHLLQKIHQPLDPQLYQHYVHLLQKRDAETLSPTEHQELIRLTHQVEALNVERVTHLTELAKLRQTTLPQLITDLGIKPIEYA